MLVAEGEIGLGRDVSQAVPGGFSSAGAINGNLRARSAAVFLHGVLGSRTAIVVNALRDQYSPADDLPSFTIEKKIGTTAPELIILRYTDAMINTLNLSVPSAGLATFSAGIISAGETELGSQTDTTIDYAAASDDLLVFHGGRIRHADTGTTLTSANDDPTFQSLEVVINNNVAADEYTIRPSRFLRTLTEGIRSVEANMTLIFENNAKYEKYSYGATGRTTPGYSIYQGALNFFLGNWQIASGDDISTSAPTGAPANPQALDITIPKLAFSGLPIALTSGRIAVTTTARALKPTSTNVIDIVVRPTAAGFNY